MKRRNALKCLGTVGVSATVPTLAIGATGEPTKEEKARKLFARSRTILERSNDLEAARSYLRDHGFNVASKTAMVDAESKVEAEAKVDDKVGTESAYEPRDELTLNIDLNVYPETAQYFASAEWMWDSQTLGPLDGVALTYKEDSWAVPPNGYDSSDFVELDPEAPWTNGYAWRYHDHNHTIDHNGVGEWRSVSLELNEYDPNIDPEDRYIWLVYTQTSSEYPAFVKGLSIGYGLLSISFDTIPWTMTQETWKRDKDGNDLKLSQADADVVGPIE
jgi:hypothetical protein